MARVSRNRGELGNTHTAAGLNRMRFEGGKKKKEVFSDTLARGRMTLEGSQENVVFVYFSTFKRGGS